MQYPHKKHPLNAITRKLTPPIGTEIGNLKKPVAKTSLITVLEAFTVSMNKIADVIDTTEREEVYAIYQALLEKAEVLAEKEAYYALFDAWRDF